MPALKQQDLQIGRHQNDEAKSKAIAGGFYDMVMEARESLGFFREEYTRTFRYYRNADDCDRLELKPPYNSRAKMNIVRDWTDKMVGSATSSKPTINATAGEDSDVPLAYLMNSALENVYRFNRMPLKVIQGARHTMTGGMCAFYSGWNPNLRDGRGEIEGRMVDGRDMVWDLSGRQIDHAVWIAEESYPTKLELAARNPEMREQIMALKGYEGEVRDDDRPKRRSAPWISPPWAESSAGQGYTPGHHEIGAGPDRPGQMPRGMGDRVQTFDIWMRPIGDGVTENYGRRACIAKDLLLVDDFNRYWCRARHPWPYSFFRMEEIAGELAPKGRMQHLVPIQRSINQLLRGLDDHSRQALHEKLAYIDGIAERADMESDAYLLKLLPDLANLEASYPRIIAVPQLGQAILGIYRLLIEAAQLTMGIGDGVLGQTPGDVTAASALKELRKIYNEGVALFVEENLNPAIREWGEITASHVAQFYSDARTIRIAGPAGEFMLDQMDPAWREVIGQTAGGDGAAMPVRFPKEWYAKIPRRFVPDPRTPGRQMPVSIFYDAEDFDIEVKVGSGAPTDPEKALQVGLVFAQNGWVDPEQVVERTDYRYRPPVPQMGPEAGLGPDPLTTEAGAAPSVPAGPMPAPSAPQGAV